MNTTCLGGTELKRKRSAEQNVALLEHPTQGSRHLKIFAPFRAAEMDTDASSTETTSNKVAAVPENQVDRLQ
jgi:hypothetical protein